MKYTPEMEKKSQTKQKKNPIHNHKPTLTPENQATRTSTTDSDNVLSNLRRHNFKVDKVCAYTEK